MDILVYAVPILLAALLVYAALQPAAFRIEREAMIGALPEQIYPLIADFNEWTAWSPWEEMDPDMRRRYSGPGHGPGAVYEWEGNNKVGKGRMEIIEAVPPARIGIRLDFIRPFEAHNRVEFRLIPAGNETRVCWVMTGLNDKYLARLMGVFVNMDKLVGRDFEKGLARLKSAAERPAAPA